MPCSSRVVSDAAGPSYPQRRAAICRMPTATTQTKLPRSCGLDRMCCYRANNTKSATQTYIVLGRLDMLRQHGEATHSETPHGETTHNETPNSEKTHSETAHSEGAPFADKQDPGIIGVRKSQRPCPSCGNFQLSTRQSSLAHLRKSEQISTHVPVRAI